MELEDGTNIIFLNSKGYGDKIAPETEDTLNSVENKPVVTEYGKKLEIELAIQKINPDAKEEYMAFTNAVLDEIIDAKEEGRQEGIAERDNSIASVMLKAKEPLAKIIQYTRLPLEKIQELAAQIGVAVVM